MPSLYDTNTLRAIEARELARLAPLALMQRAAAALTDALTDLARARPARSPILSLIGPGNNGADALLASLELRRRGFDVRAVLMSPGMPSAADARAAHARAHSGGLPMSDTLSAQALDGALVIDGLFGIGLSRQIGRAHV